MKQPLRIRTGAQTIQPVRLDYIAWSLFCKMKETTETIEYNNNNNPTHTWKQSKHFECKQITSLHAAHCTLRTFIKWKNKMPRLVLYVNEDWRYCRNIILNDSVPLVD